MLDGDTQKGYYIWVCQAVPHNGLLAKDLRTSLIGEEEATTSTTHLGSLLWILSVNPHALDANARVVEGSLVNIAIMPCGERMGTNV